MNEALHITGLGAMGLALGIAAAACAPASSNEDTTSIYALARGVDGVYFYPPLGPEPAAGGPLETSVLDGLSVVLEADDGSGAFAARLALFDEHTSPRLALLEAHERYGVSVPAAAYLTERARPYRFRVLLDGSELASAVLTDRVFDVLAAYPGLQIGVQFRVEGRAVRQRTRTHGVPAHCSDGIRNKDETDVDCGGGCPPCCVPAPEVCNGIDDDCDGQADEGLTNLGSCNTGIPGACAVGRLICSNGQPTCQQTIFPTTEGCDGIDNDCDGIPGACASNRRCASDHRTCVPAGTCFFGGTGSVYAYGSYFYVGQHGTRNNDVDCSSGTCRVVETSALCPMTTPSCQVTNGTATCWDACPTMTCSGSPSYCGYMGASGSGEAQFYTRKYTPHCVSSTCVIETIQTICAPGTGCCSM